MRALLFANQPGIGLAPMTDDTNVTLLPVLCKPLIVHTLEALTEADVVDVLVVVAAHAERIEAELGDGSRWGLRLSYCTTPDERPWPDVVARSGQFLADQSEFLAVRGDVARSSGALEEFLAVAALQPGSNVEGVGCQGIAAGLRLVRSAWDDAGTPLLLKTTCAVPVVDHASLLAANCRAAAGELGSRHHDGHALAKGVRIGSHSEIARGSLGAPPFSIDEGVKVRSGARLEGPVVLGRNVIVEEGAQIHNALVMPNTYVGRQVELRNAIAWRKQLIRVDPGLRMGSGDAALPAALSNVPVLRALGGYVQRCVALMLLLAGAPLWPLVAVVALLSRPRHPFHRVELLGNRRPSAGGTEDRGGRQPFSCWEPAVPLPWLRQLGRLRHLTRLIPVIQGRLALVGVRPLSVAQTDALQDDWQRLREQAPVGLIGPALFHGECEEEKLLHEALFAQGEGRWKTLAQLSSSLAALGSLSAWTLQSRRRGESR